MRGPRPVTTHRRRLGVSAILVLVLLACGDGAPPQEPNPGEGMSASALQYLQFALDIMQAYSIKRYEISWGPFRQAAVEKAGNAQSVPDTYGAIRFALQELGDHHSFFLPPGAQGSAVAPEAPVAPEALVQAAGPLPDRLEGDVGYVHVGAFSGTTAQANELATYYHREIEGMDTLGVCGWVVDLRGNGGGNMWPMVAGIGPIAGTGVLGYFVDPDSVVSTWTYASGASSLDGVPLSQAADPYTLRDPGGPVAVLTDSLTASSGEATVIAFRGRPDTRSFGRPTRGLSTANRGFRLSDGAMIYLTVSTMADRTGRLYGQEVEPDVSVPGRRTGDPATDAALGAAVSWLMTQPACGG